ncbi:MAG TPA: hypothetical protein VM029_22920 [Opitutaceae bacterium]|nr:hypothetical protein [Opitutaceae bacterium]
MAKCSYCNSSILFGGVREGELRFCNQKCQQEGALLSVAQLVPAADVRQRVTAIHQGPCPKCASIGAIDVHTSHSIWSAVLLTSWKSTPQVCCLSCGKKAKMVGTLTSFLFGWWGFPWGLIFTPIQIGRNLVGLARSPSPFVPSAQLERIVRLNLAAELQQAGAVPPALAKA